MKTEWSLVEGDTRHLLNSASIEDQATKSNTTILFVIVMTRADQYSSVMWTFIVPEQAEQNRTVQHELQILSEVRGHSH